MAAQSGAGCGTVLRFKPRGAEEGGEEVDGEGEGLMAKALFVEDSESDENRLEDGPPMDGMEYLRRVIKERRNVPETVVASIDPARLKHSTATGGKHSDIGVARVKAPIPSLYCPSVRWQNQQVAEFSHVRQKLARHSALLRSSGEMQKVPKLPVKENQLLWCLFCYGSDVWKAVRMAREQAESSDTEEELSQTSSSHSSKKEKILNPDYDHVIQECKEGSPPLVSLLVSIPVHVVEQVLEYQVSWLECIGWRAEFGPWLYSLLSRLEKPLTPDIGSILRDLALICARERFKIASKLEAAKQNNLDSCETVPSNSNTDEESPAMSTDAGEDADPAVAAFNLLICLVARYFDQSDLADTED